MGVRVNYQTDSERLGALAGQPIDVQAKRMSIDLDPCAMLGSGLHNGFEIDQVWLAAEQEPARSVAQHGHPRMADGANDSGCHLFGSLIEMGMHAGHNIVEAG